MIINSAGPLDPADLRHRAEELLRKKPADMAAIPPEKAERLLHELQVHQIELEMQNYELRKAQEEIERSRVKYLDLFDWAPMGYFTVSEKGLILEANYSAAGLLDMTIAYARDRKAFVKPIASFQHNAFKIVDMATEIALGRSFLDRLIGKHMRGDKIVTEVSMAKAWIPEMANRVAYHCVQLHGGYGRSTRSPASTGTYGSSPSSRGRPRS